MAREQMCINHTSVEAAARCKQCSRPICKACFVEPKLGPFCSDDCSEKYTAFRGRHSGEGDFMTRFMRKVKSFIVTLIVLAILAAGIIYAAGKYGHFAPAEELLRKVGLM